MAAIRVVPRRHTKRAKAANHTCDDGGDEAYSALQNESQCDGNNQQRQLQSDNRRHGGEERDSRRVALPQEEGDTKHHERQGQEVRQRPSSIVWDVELDETERDKPRRGGRAVLALERPRKMRVREGKHDRERKAHWVSPHKTSHQ